MPLKKDKPKKDTIEVRVAFPIPPSMAGGRLNKNDLRREIRKELAYCLDVPERAIRISYI